MDLSESISDHPGSVRQIQAPPTSCGNTSVSKQTGCASKSELHQGRLLDGFRGQHVSLDSPGGSMESFNQRPEWQALSRHFATIESAHLRNLFASDPTRGERFAFEAEGIYLDYSKNRVTDET